MGALQQLAAPLRHGTVTQRNDEGASVSQPEMQPEGSAQDGRGDGRGTVELTDTGVDMGAADTAAACSPVIRCGLGSRRPVI